MSLIAHNNCHALGVFLAHYSGPVRFRVGHNAAGNNSECGGDACDIAQNAAYEKLTECRSGTESGNPALRLAGDLSVSRQ
jgi:hypothetical protein